jgi:hypothetical protein
MNRLDDHYHYRPHRRAKSEEPELQCRSMMIAAGRGRSSSDDTPHRPVPPSIPSLGAPVYGFGMVTRWRTSSQQSCQWMGCTLSPPIIETCGRWKTSKANIFKRPRPHEFELRVGFMAVRVGPSSSADWPWSQLSQSAKRPWSSTAPFRPVETSNLVSISSLHAVSSKEPGVLGGNLVQ